MIALNGFQIKSENPIDCENLPTISSDERRDWDSLRDHLSLPLRVSSTIHHLKCKHSTADKVSGPEAKVIKPSTHQTTNEAGRECKQFVESWHGMTKVEHGTRQYVVKCQRIKLFASCVHRWIFHRIEYPIATTTNISTRVLFLNPLFSIISLLSRKFAEHKQRPPNWKNKHRWGESTRLDCNWELDRNCLANVIADDGWHRLQYRACLTSILSRKVIRSRDDNVRWQRTDVVLIEWIIVVRSQQKAAWTHRLFLVLCRLRNRKFFFSLRFINRNTKKSFSRSRGQLFCLSLRSANSPRWHSRFILLCRVAGSQFHQLGSTTMTRGFSFTRFCVACEKLLCPRREEKRLESFSEIFREKNFPLAIPPG